jgi:hypothetical protein
MTLILRWHREGVEEECQAFKLYKAGRSTGDRPQIRFSDIDDPAEKVIGVIFSNSDAKCLFRLANIVYPSSLSS